ncbi:MAG: valine--tRNA ligase, partial [Oscillospiraceae bacterium]|nr:valine--tRNA ligase [Oscillospiraceae bacterium]
ISSFPAYDSDLEFKEEEAWIEQIKEAITGIRNVRANMNVHPSKKSKLIFVTDKYSDFIIESEEFIKKLGFAEEIEVVNDNKSANIPENSVNIVTSELEIFIPFEDLVDINEEIERLEREKAKILIEKAKTDGMLSNPGFIEKAPPAKVEEQQKKLDQFNEMIQSIDERINALKK